MLLYGGPFLHEFKIGSIHEGSARHMTGTMYSKRAGMDRTIQFVKSASCASGYYNWSTDGRMGVVQTCWMDRAAVSLCSTAFGAKLRGSIAEPPLVLQITRFRIEA